MSAEDEIPRIKRRFKKRWLAIAATSALTIGSAYVTLGPGAGWVVEHLADGQRVWRLGRIKIEGVTGGWLGNLRAEHLTIEDEEGVWLEGRDVALRWRPQDIAFGAVRVHTGSAASIAVLRRPTLLEKRPSGDLSFDIFLGDIQVETITLHESVFGEAAAFTGSLSLAIDDESLEGLTVELLRTDTQADRLRATYRPDEDYALNLDAASAPGGIFARALGVVEQGLTATANGDGDGQTGAAQFRAAIGDMPLLEGEARWTPARWSIDANGRLDLLPALLTLARRIGPSVALTASGDRVGDFTAHAETPFLALDLTGELNEERELVGPARIVATTERLSHIARESPFELGAARIDGELRGARGTIAVQGTLDAQSIEALGQTARFTGPIRAALTPERFTLESDLRAHAGSPPVFAQARLRTALEHDRARQRFQLREAALTSDAVALDAQGWVNQGQGEFAGEWRVRRLGAIAGDLTGEASGRYRAFTEARGDDHVWTTTVIGTGAGVGGDPDIVAQLTGAAPRFDGRFTYENGGITVSHARLDGENLRAAATGRIVRGEANLGVEATARGPLTIGGAVLDGALDATGRVTGRITRPTLTATASLASFSAGGVVVAQPVVDFRLAPSGRGYAGNAHVVGTASGQPLNATANVGITGSTIRLTELDGQWGGLLAQGDATIASAGVSANLDVNGAIDELVAGMTGRFVSTVALTPQTLAVNAQIMDARAGELRIRAATLNANGPLDNIATEVSLRGRLRQAPLAFEGAGTADLSGETKAVTLNGRGELAEVEVATRAPMTIGFRPGVTTAALDVALGDGFVTAQWEDRGRALSGSAQIEDAPIEPLAAIWGERADGRIDGRITVANAGGGLSGNADITLADARLAGRQRGRLNMHIVGDLDPSRLQAVLDATSTEGLVAHFEADAPVVTSTSPIRIALAPERRGRATWSVRGPADALWAAARLQDQQLSGELNGEGEIAFGAGYLAGDGFIEIVDGRFEDKLTGVTLVDLDVRVALNSRGVTIENFTASGPQGGRLTATGGSANAREGRIAVNVDDMLIANRPEARARASGELTLAWEGLQSELSGQLNIDEADIDIAAHPSAGIPTLDVIEINRPGYEDEIEAMDDAPARNGGTALDVRIRAPGRVFTRGRGVDAEWALDLRLAGTAANPRIFGTAHSVRGTISLSGQPFELDDARIDFDGDPMDAQINITATRDTADLTAYMRLTGTARDPEISFTSDPGLPEDEILPQILFGRSVEDLSALEAAQLAASIATLSGRASLDLVDAARAAAGLDRFNVRQDEDGGFLVAGGVYLTRSVYLEVARTGLGETQTRVEYTIRPRLVLITSFLSTGDQTVSLRWRRESD